MGERTSEADEAASAKLSTGVPGLDEVLGGGLRVQRLYLALGDPGVGKTTMGLQFLLEGVRRGEPSLYATLSETREEVEEIAASHGWSLDGVELVELHAVEGSVGARDAQTMFHPVELDLDRFTAPLRETIERVRPARVVIDSLSELRILAGEMRRFRAQIMALKEHLTSLGCTLLLLDDRLPGNPEMVPQTFAHGVLALRLVTREFGPPRRRLSVSKLRGARIREGYHDFQIVTGGIVVYPRVVPSERRAGPEPGLLSSGVDGLDAMLGGGLTRATSALVMGPAGAGKSVVVTQYAHAAAARGERAAMFVFDESRETFLARAAGAGLDLRPHLASGLCSLTQMDPLEMAPDQFSHAVVSAVDPGGARLVIIDSLNGYMSSTPEESFLAHRFHELLACLGRLDVITLVTLSQHGFVGPMADTNLDVSYLADTVILLRFFEAVGEMRKCISVPKMRSGFHQLSLREYRISREGLEVGEPVSEFQGVLTGAPTYLGHRAPLLGGGGADDDHPA
jgi:circadian clock protein KaiC